MSQDYLTIVEAWKTIAEFPNYEVSNLGRIRRGRPGVNTQVGKIRKPQIHRDGYLQIGLWRDGKLSHKFIHVLVARAFLGVPPIGHEVNHIDGNKQNPVLDNLEYKTHSGNLRHAIETGLQIVRRGEELEQSKLNNKDVEQILQLCEAGMSNTQIASQFGVNKNTVRSIRLGRTWTHVWRQVPETKKGNTKLNEQDKGAIKAMRATGALIKDITATFDISRTTVFEILRH